MPLSNLYGFHTRRKDLFIAECVFPYMAGPRRPGEGAELARFALLAFKVGNSTDHQLVSRADLSSKVT